MTFLPVFSSKTSDQHIRKLFVKKNVARKYPVVFVKTAR